jgi:hypothetical protein
MYAKVKQAFLDGIELYAGKEARRNVEREGLAKMHKHLPASKLLLFEDFPHEDAAARPLLLVVTGSGATTSGWKAPSTSTT